MRTEQITLITILMAQRNLSCNNNNTNNNNNNRNLSHKDKMFNGGALGNYSLAGFEMVSTSVINTFFFFAIIVIIIFSTKGLIFTVNCSEKVQKTCIGLGEANIF